MRILLVTLIDLPTDTPPLGAACITAALRKQGQVVENLMEFVDADAPPVTVISDALLRALPFRNKDDVLHRIFSFQPDVVGFSCNCSNRYSTASLARALKAEAPHIVLVAGGPDIHPSQYDFMTGSGLETHREHMDYLVQGEGESKAVRLVRALDDRGTCEGDAGIFRCADMTDLEITSGYVEREEHPDALPFPDFGSAPRFERFYGEGGGWGGLPVWFSRGCTGNCSFCNRSEYFRHYRFRPGTSVFSEMRAQADRYGVDQFLIIDDDPITRASMPEIERLCDLLIDAGSPYRWQILHANFIPRLAEPDAATRLAAAGMNGIRFGVDNLAPRVRAHMRKSPKLEILSDVLSNLQLAGVDSGVHIIYAYPTETDEDFLLNLAWVRDHGHLVSHLSIFGFVMNDWYLSKRADSVTRTEVDSPSGGPGWRSEHVNRDVMWERFHRFMDVLSHDFRGSFMISDPDGVFTLRSPAP